MQAPALSAGAGGAGGPRRQQQRQKRRRLIGASASSMALAALLAASMWRQGRAFVLPSLGTSTSTSSTSSRGAVHILATSSSSSSSSEDGGMGSSGSSGRLKRLARSSSFSFNRAPGSSGKGDPPSPPPPPPSKQGKPAAAAASSGRAGGSGGSKGGGKEGGEGAASARTASSAPRRGGGRGPAKEDAGQHLTPKGMGPQEGYDIDARPNSRKARKAAAAATAGAATEGWERPSRLQQRRNSRAAKAAEEKMKRLKTRTFDKSGLLAPRGQKAPPPPPPPLSPEGRGLGGGVGEADDDELQCEHFFECAGCFFRSGLTETPLMEDARIFFRTAIRLPEGRQFEVSLGSGVHEWRTQAKLAVARLSKWGGCCIGLYAEGTHRVMPIPKCRVHHPSINRAVEVISRATEAMKTRAFDQDQMDGALRYIQCAVERRTGKVQLTLVWNAPGRKEAGAELARLLKAIRAADPTNELWHSIWINFRTGPGNAIFSRDPRSWHKAHGQDFLTEAVGPSRVVFHLTPQLFRQGNLDGFGKLVARAQDFVPERAVICELYAGVGVIGLNMLGKARELRFSDINPFLPAAVERTLDGLSEKRRERVAGFMVGTALDALEAGQAQGADLLIVDPPRKGLEPEVLAHLTGGKRDPLAGDVRRIIYVSCGFDALKRDAQALVGAGWRVVHAEGFVLFPGSDHLETLCVLDR